MGKNVEFEFVMVYIGSIGETMPRDQSPYRYSLLVEGWVSLPCLKLPCRHLGEKKCLIHPFKPLICISFPYHLPGWKENDPCHLIRELALRKKEGNKPVVPINAKKAICLYTVARSATMYQLNLPIYSLDSSRTRLIQREGFRDLFDGAKSLSAKLASPTQISSWVTKHFTKFTGRDEKMDRMYSKIKSTISTAIDDPDFQFSNISFIEEFSEFHFTESKRISDYVKYFLSLINK
jgi:Fe-S-cluster containining protein